MDKVWIAMDYLKCSGCGLCEIVCSLKHEGKIWPEASRIRVFRPLPGLEFPHVCVQCGEHPCIESCPVDALRVDKETGAVLVEKEKCTGCGNCVECCPGNIPFLHPAEEYALICDLCGGDPECVRVCDFGAIFLAKRIPKHEATYSAYARKPEDIADDLKQRIYGGVL